MKHYIHLFQALFKNNLVREMEFRSNFLTGLVMQALWATLQIILIEIIFTFANSISGWTKYEVLVLIGIFRIIQGLFNIFLYSNVVYLPEQVSRGELDYTLTKPINSMFLTSIRKHELGKVGTLLVGVLILIYSFSSQFLSVSLFNIAYILLMIPLGLVVLYCLMFIVSTFSLFFTRISAISSIYDVISNILRVPTSVLSGKNKLLDLFLLPLIIVVTLPTQIVLGKVHMIYLPIQILLVILLFVLTYMFWNFALKHYSSASS